MRNHDDQPDREGQDRLLSALETQQQLRSNPPSRLSVIVDGETLGRVDPSPRPVVFQLPYEGLSVELQDEAGTVRAFALIQEDRFENQAFDNGRIILTLQQEETSGIKLAVQLLLTTSCDDVIEKSWDSKTDARYQLGLAFIRKYIPQEEDVFEMAWQAVALRGGQTVELGGMMGSLGMAGPSTEQLASIAIISLFEGVDPHADWRAQIVERAEKMGLEPDLVAKLAKYAEE